MHIRVFFIYFRVAARAGYHAVTCQRAKAADWLTRIMQNTQTHTRESLLTWHGGRRNPIHATWLPLKIGPTNMNGTATSTRALPARHSGRQCNKKRQTTHCEWTCSLLYKSNTTVSLYHNNKIPCTELYFTGAWHTLCVCAAVHESNCGWIEVQQPAAAAGNNPEIIRCLCVCVCMYALCARWFVYNYIMCTHMICKRISHCISSRPFHCTCAVWHFSERWVAAATRRQLHVCTMHGNTIYAINGITATGNNVECMDGELLLLVVTF